MNKPKLDKAFYPMIKALDDFAQKVKSEPEKNRAKVTLVVERNGGYNYVYSFDAFRDGINDELNYRVAERLAKTVLWVCGGYKIGIAGSKEIFRRLKEAYSKNGARAFDEDFMSGVYEKPFEVVWLDKVPPQKNASMKVGGHLKGCRIGFDAGGSDRKVSAVIDGEVVYSEEVVWNPKITADPHYHHDEILTAMKTAASKMPRVDSIGVSSAGVYVDNKIMVASLFLKVDKEKYGDYVKNMYINIAKEMGDVPIEVANDGDVTALAGSIDLADNKVLGIAMGTSEAVGYINADGGINGWLSELAFVPVDFSESAMQDEWSGDFGVGCKYFSQDAVIKLAELGGFKFEDGLTPAQKLKVIQALMEKGDELARTIYEDIGVYLAHTLPYYAKFYDMKHVLLLGRVTGGEGGNIILDTCKKVLAAEYPEFKGLDISLPDESNRRVGQSIAAASLCPDVE
ncbi:MAG: ROK family protein [Clostridia bacterium]|jgi:predicted NBD/HSP70 family sugar kinase|nr:ROK family protein [Clostridia bacterium]